MTSVPRDAAKEEPERRPEGNIFPLRRSAGLDGSLPPAIPQHNLPHLVSGFIGRERELVDAAALLDGARLVTLTGAAGMGKTRLALEVAGRRASGYPDGARVVDLASLTDPAGLADTVADALFAQNQLARPTTTADLAGEVGERRLLVVLDGCEHLLDACTPLVEQLLRSCPGLDVLATSRQPLGLGGEHTWNVGPLSLPDPDEVSTESLMATEAGELFLRRATEANPSFRCGDAVASTVAEICCRLDGLPLAIELAAWRVTSLAPADILERLDDRFHLLTAASPRPARHQTLLGALEWSHDLLTPPEAALLRRLSVFAGWSLAAAEVVCAGDPLCEGDVVDHLAGLVSKSLVVVEPRGDGVRYHLLETVSVWADAKLEAVAESAAVRRAHAIWCVALAERADGELVGPDPQPWLDALDVEHDNLRAALNWSRAAGEVEIGLRLVTALARFWRLRGRLDEAQRWLEWAVIASAESPAHLRGEGAASRGPAAGPAGRPRPRPPAPRAELGALPRGG